MSGRPTHEFKTITFSRFDTQGSRCPMMVDLEKTLEAESADRWLPTGIAFFTETSCTWFRVVLTRTKEQA